MISIIICSINPHLASQVKQNVDQTIGVEHEVIIIDNSILNESIFTVYNKGIKQSKYPHLCLIHEDILFHTSNWGAKIIAHLSIPNTGILGIAGSHYLPNAITAWGFTPFQSMHYLQKLNAQNESQLFEIKFDLNDKTRSSVVTVDGVFLALNKEITQTILFDETTFNGFHCYDIDLCMQAHSLGYNNYVIFDVVLEHFSIGSFNKQWLESSKIWHKKWHHFLPTYTHQPLPHQVFEINWCNFCWLIYILWKQKNFNIPTLKSAFSLLRFKYIINVFNIKAWRTLLWFFFKAPF